MFQCVNRSLSKYAIAIESKHEKKEDRDKEIAHKAEGARRMYAAMLAKALEYGGADVGFITYKSTQEWIEANCFVPHWLKLAHFGASTGTNAFQTVRALFVVGRPLASPEDIARQAEALTGEYVAERTYQEKRKHGKISIVPNAAAEDTVLVDARTMAHPTAERLRRQVTEARWCRPEGAPAPVSEERPIRSICTYGRTWPCPSWGKSSRCCGRNWRRTRCRCPTRRRPKRG